MSLIDLHTHSTASDGSLSPASLIDEAEKKGVSVLALTDHDSINGLKEASLAARQRGISFIPGIELEINNTGGQFHLLGLGLNQPSPAFITAVIDIARRREERNLEIVKKMNEAGIALSYDEIKVEGKSVGRPHFAEYLTKHKIVKNREQAFKRYLGKGKPFYIPKTGLDFDEAVRLIHESGGIAVLAHPMSLYIAWGKLPAYIKTLKEKGLDGLEAWHPAAKVSSCKRLRDLGNKLDLCITAGSDFHGESRPDRKLGITAGGKKIDETLIIDNNLLLGKF